eukprot:12841521-Ditylum_brightwellii.AAC.1
MTGQTKKFQEFVLVLYKVPTPAFAVAAVIFDALLPSIYDFLFLVATAEQIHVPSTGEMAGYDNDREVVLHLALKYVACDMVEKKGEQVAA